MKKKFDPYLWASQIIPEKYLNYLIKFFCIGIFIYFLVQRILEYKNFYLKPLWFVETLIYIVLAIAFFFRVPPIDRSTGIKEIIIPLIGGVFPFLLLTSKPHPAIYNSDFNLQIIFWGMTLFTSLTIWGMWHLKSSFSITVEARKLVTTGPFQLIRHPIYLGELITALFVCIWRFSWLNLGFYFLLVIIQLYRSKMEQQKLAKNFEDYQNIMMKKWWFF